MTKKEIYILLRHELRQALDAQDERLRALENDVRSALNAAPGQEQPQDTPHEREPDNATLAAMFRNSPDQKRWLIASGIDSFPRFMAFLSGLENIDAVRVVAKQEGYEK